MKGVVFTSFLEMVEEAHGIDMVDTLIDQSDLPSGGSYTAVGTYDHTEIVNLVVTLSKETKTEVPDLLKAFGKYLFGILIRSYPQFGEGISSSLDLLESIEEYIHVEVRKLYPDAELPRFECSRPKDGQLRMLYESSRHFEDLCEGLIQGAIDHYNETATIEREALPDEREVFLVTLQ